LDLVVLFLYSSFPLHLVWHSGILALSFCSVSSSLFHPNQFMHTARMRTCRANTGQQEDARCRSPLGPRLDSTRLDVERWHWLTSNSGCCRCCCRCCSPSRTPHVVVAVMWEKYRKEEAKGWLTTIQCQSVLPSAQSSVPHTLVQTNER
jgi:hypothetical protein